MSYYPGPTLLSLHSKMRLGLSGGGMADRPLTPCVPWGLPPKPQAAMEGLVGRKISLI